MNISAQPCPLIKLQLDAYIFTFAIIYPVHQTDNTINRTTGLIRYYQKYFWNMLHNEVYRVHEDIHGATGKR